MEELIITKQNGLSINSIIDNITLTSGETIFKIKICYIDGTEIQKEIGDLYSIEEKYKTRRFDYMESLYDDEQEINDEQKIDGEKRNEKITILFNTTAFDYKSSYGPGSIKNILTVSKTQNNFFELIIELNVELCAENDECIFDNSTYFTNQKSTFKFPKEIKSSIINFIKINLLKQSEDRNFYIASMDDEIYKYWRRHKERRHNIQIKTNKQ